MRGSRRLTLLGLLLLVAVPASPVASATPPPNVFAVRLQGWAVQSTLTSTSTQVVPGAAYSFAKLNSTPKLGGGGRELDMQAVAANGEDQGFGGVVLFIVGGSLPGGSSAFPGYAEAFFPTFEGKSEVSEKCAFNQTEAKETPECREQPGPYAYAQVFPDQATPRVVGQARNAGNETQGETTTISEVVPAEDGSIQALQRNVGRDLGVPGTPITVQSFIAEVKVLATLDGVSAEGRCEAAVSVGGQKVVSNKELQQLLGPFSTSTGVTVTYVEPTEPEVVEKPDGGIEIACRGPQFVVSAPIQGGTSTTYTYGRTFAAAGQPVNREAPGFGDAGGVLGDAGGLTPPPMSSPAGSAAPLSPPAVDVPALEPTPPPEPESPIGAGADELASGPGLIEKPIDALPVGAWTAAAATALPLAIWLLVGVTGSLARGSTRLRLPPFHDRSGTAA